MKLRDQHYEAYHQVGIYTPHPQGRKTGRPASHAVYKFELVLNLKTAKTLGLTVRRRYSPSPTR